jgi:DNA-binding HxlR family transcriptional regulator
MNADTGVRPCSIARSMEVLGQRWSLLVLRELLFENHRFDAIVKATGAPRDILATRLRTLEANGLVERRRYQDRPPRFAYHLTARGWDTAEVLLSLMAFGDRHLSDERPVTWQHGQPDHPHPLDPVLTCRTCGKPATEGLHEPTGPGAPR